MPHARVNVLGGRVIDPASGRNEVIALRFEDGTITHIGQVPDDADLVVDATGLVVAPGFIDLHSHAQTRLGLRLQALDGVTTALDLEAGALPVRPLLAKMAAHGMPLNFGFSASWSAARMHVLDGAPLRDEAHPAGPASGLKMFSDHHTGERWGQAATAEQHARILALLEDAVAHGAIGIGMLLGYAPQTPPEEVRAVAELAARLQVPLFVHSRSMSPETPPTILDAVDELIGLAEDTGVHVHLCHLNSTSHARIAQVIERIRVAAAAGTRVTTEVYPFGYGCTDIGAAFLAPEVLADQGLRPDSIHHLGHGRKVRDFADLAALRAEDPSALCTIDFLDEDRPEDLAALMRAVAAPETAIASDSDTLVGVRGVPDPGGDEWPAPDGLSSHPRGAGCFAKAQRLLTAEDIPLTEFVRKASLLPAQILEGSVPAFRRKGRLEVGSDADIVVFDPARVRERGTVLQPAASEGVQHLFVGGTAVVRDGELLVDALPGAAVPG
ncbi:hypothetical protein ASD65_02680 [Microbacterium sp. Root61]|uniref:amidohydrolase family protein n=1 Tax=Microbacterium sp. Root61 TaxID=1736570 RepID=UPI0006FA7889|nr:amidohydrolase family protein [Microbacterium sp. Root61]KRA23442.1 hypothetical protein ASD65_02680 [Microbacterium sp. Root61]